MGSPLPLAQGDPPGLPGLHFPSSAPPYKTYIFPPPPPISLSLSLSFSHTQINTRAYTHTHIYTHMYTHVLTCTQMYSHTCTHTHTCPICILSHLSHFTLYLGVIVTLKKNCYCVRCQPTPERNHEHLKLSGSHGGREKDRGSQTACLFPWKAAALKNVLLAPSAVKRCLGSQVGPLLMAVVSLVPY